MKALNISKYIATCSLPLLAPVVISGCLESSGGTLQAGVQSGATVLTEVADDTAPALGGNLDINSFSILSTGTDNITLDPSGTGEVVSTKAISRQGFFQAYNTTLTNTAAGEATIPFDISTRKDTNYYDHDETINQEQVTISVDGDYKITYVIGLDSDYANRVAMKAWLTGNGTELVPSAGWCYLRQSTAGGQLNSITATTIQTITAPTIIRLHLNSFSAVSTQVNRDVDAIPQQTWILIEKI